MAKPTVLPEWDQTEVNSVEPDATHKAEGWLAPAGVPEKPPYQSFNFWQNSVWKWLEEINIKGLLGYDALTDYLANLSYAIGSDGNFYQCKINNGPSSAVVNPVGDVTGTWEDVINVTAPTARGFIDGLIMENAADADHDITVNEGICRNFSNTVPIPLATAITKQIDANWAEGTNAGGFPSGLTLTIDTWYHVFIIMSADGTKVDVGFDTSLIATNLLADATDYSLYRRIGSVLTDGTTPPNIYPFLQIGDNFIWDTPINDFADGASGTTDKTSAAMRVPLGVNTIVDFTFGSSGAGFVYFHHPDTADPGAPSAAGPGTFFNPAGTIDIFRVHTNKSSQINYRTVGNWSIFIQTLTYEDFRGKDL